MTLSLVNMWTVSSHLVKTMKISDETHRELTKVSAKITAEDGERRTFDETIMEIITVYRQKEE